MVDKGFEIFNEKTKDIKIGNNEFAEILSNGGIEVYQKTKGHKNNRRGAVARSANFSPLKMWKISKQQSPERSSNKLVPLKQLSYNQIQSE